MDNAIIHAGMEHWHYVIELLTQYRPVWGAARLARITEDAVEGILPRAVERGLSRRASPSSHCRPDVG